MVSAARSPETKLRTPTERAPTEGARIWRTRSDGKPADFREASHSAGIPQTLGAGMCFMAPALLNTSEAASLPEIGLACGGRRGKHTASWGMKVTLVEVKQVELAEQMIRATPLWSLRRAQPAHETGSRQAIGDHAAS